MARAARFIALNAIPILALAAFAFWVLGFLLHDDLYIFGDNPGQFYRLWYPLQEALSGLGSATGWNPSWYAGYPELQFYPPGFVYAGMVANFLSLGQLSPFLTYEVLRFFAYLLPALTAYALFAWLRTGKATSFAAGLFTLIFSDVYGGIAAVQIGMLGDRLALGMYPLALLAGIWGLEKRGPFALIVTLGLAIAATVLLHPFQVVTPLVGLAVYVVVRRIRLRAFAYFVLAATFAAGLLAFWLVPLAVHSEYATPVLRASLSDLQAWLLGGRQPIFVLLAILGVSTAFRVPGRTVAWGLVPSRGGEGQAPTLRESEDLIGVLRRHEVAKAALLAIGLTPIILLALIIFTYTILIDRFGFYTIDPIRFIASIFLCLAILAGVGLVDLLSLVLARCLGSTGPLSDPVGHAQREATPVIGTEGNPHPTLSLSEGRGLPSPPPPQRVPSPRPPGCPLGAERVRVRALGLWVKRPRAFFKTVIHTHAGATKDENAAAPAVLSPLPSGCPLGAERVRVRVAPGLIFGAVASGLPLRQPGLLLGAGAGVLAAYMILQPLAAWRDATSTPPPKSEPQFLSAVVQRYQLDKLWAAIRSQPPGRLLVVSSQLRLRKFGEPLPTYLFTLLPYYTGRETIGGTFHHWSPVATYYWYGRTHVPVMRDRTDLMDNQSLFGMNWTSMDEETLYRTAKRYNVSTIVATEYDGLARAFFDKSKHFGATYNDGAVVLYQVNGYTPNLIDFDPSTVDAELLRDDANEIQVKVNRSDAGANLVVKVAYYPLWQAETDGHPIEMSADEYGLMRLRLPAGTDYHVSIRYAPRLAEQLGRAVSLGTLLLVAVGLVLVTAQKRLAKRPQRKL